MKVIIHILLFISSIALVQAQHSVARIWNEATLNGIRGDLARPTVHARNLFHISVAMYDAWAVYNEEADTYFLGKTVHGFNSPFTGTPIPTDNLKAAQEEAISFAVYRLLKHRFAGSPGEFLLLLEINQLMRSMGYDQDNTGTNYKCCPAELGNYIAQQIILYGLQDGSNEIGAYENLFYEPINPPMLVEEPGNTDILDLNRWQPLSFVLFIDQSGNPSGSTPDFVSPEWGQVLPFSLNRDDADIFQKNGDDYWVYNDPGPPPYLDTTAVGGLSEEYKWGFSMVNVWSSLLDPADGVMLDISPASIGNILSYPSTLADYHNFYDYYNGGDTGLGYTQNPRTGLPYQPQIVHRADYARVLAEFWADGPDSETPPGHWFTIFNYICEQPALENKMRGMGKELDDLEWDVKGYFALGGAMHDVAISIWGIKGWYDYVRPVSAIRGMAELGQSSDPSKPSYHPGGLPLDPGYVELIEVGDPLQGDSGQYVHDLKLKGWLGPDYITDPVTDVAGVGWVRANYWWPYQRPTFVSPPFAGYLSGHSTYSRAAAEVLTAMTGDPYFPGGMGEFHCPKNEFLIFEDGPSTDLTLQWATYRDASDQCSLSRIYGGIHPPADDIPGRLIGQEIGVNAFAFAEQYFTGGKSENTVDAFHAFPNPTNSVVQLELDFEGELPVQVVAADGKIVRSSILNFNNNSAFINLTGLSDGVYTIVGYEGEKDRKFKVKIVFNND